MKAGIEPQPDETATAPEDIAEAKQVVDYFLRWAAEDSKRRGNDHELFLRELRRALTESSNERDLKPEPTDAKGEYTVTLTVSGDRVNRVLKRTRELYPDCEIEVENANASVSRVVRLEEAKSIVENLQSEIQEWRDNLPENLQFGSKAEELDACIDSLDGLINAFDDMEFPSAF